MLSDGILHGVLRSEADLGKLGPTASFRHNCQNRSVRATQRSEPKQESSHDGADHRYHRGHYLDCADPTPPWPGNGPKVRWAGADYGNQVRPNPMIQVSYSSPLRRRSGFSLVEMIGVLAIIAILAVIIVPKVFATIASSRITNAVASANSVKSSVSEFAGKYGTLPLANTTLRIDDLLVKAGLLESRFSVKVGNAPSGSQGGTWALVNGAWVGTAGGTNQNAAPIQSRIISVNSTQGSPATANGANFCLSPSTPLNLTTDSLPANSRVIVAVIAGVTPTEALELSRRIDGDSLSETDSSTADARGKVVYNVGATRNVYIYLASQ